MNPINVQTESDVEQKVIWPILTNQLPAGLGYPIETIRTKPDIRRLTIGKGGEEKLYYPDYVCITKGYPSLLIEAKSPGENLGHALREARLYAHELNAKYPEGVNPVHHVICCDGNTLLMGRWDTAHPTIEMAVVDLHPANASFASFIDLCSYNTESSRIESLIRDQNPTRYYCPGTMVGGKRFQHEELPPNTFGSNLAIDFRDVFNPTTREERNRVVRRAYVESARRERYIEPIDRIIRTALPPAYSGTTTLPTEDPQPLLKALRNSKQLDHQILLIIGGVGSGKSTFIDYLREVKLPSDLRAATVWAHIDMNSAPVSREEVYPWFLDQLRSDLHASRPGMDFDDLSVIRTVFSVEIARFRKGPAKLLKENSEAYDKKLYELLVSLQEDRVAATRALCRFLCGDTGKRLIVVLDNCDKRNRESQLLFFEVSQWLQKEFQCLVILPLREETYDNHRNQPPLDTAIKDLVFRIEPPMFQEVLRQRINLALETIDAGKRMEYSLPNGARVVFTGADQAAYLEAILKSIHAHDRFVRRLITGLAGRNMRKALEVFLDFCKSGHITEDLIFKIRQSEGRFELPFSVVARVLLRGGRRYYRSSESHVKNILSLNPADVRPNHLTKFAVLKWLEFRLSSKGPGGVVGFHRAGDLVKDLVLAGFEYDRIWKDLLELLGSLCLVAEHFETDRLEEDDLIKLSPAGWVHLDMLNEVEYYGAIAEDTYYGDLEVAREIHHRMSGPDHFSHVTTALNAKALIDYLQMWSVGRGDGWNEFVETKPVLYLNPLEVLETAKGAVRSANEKYGWEMVASKLKKGATVEALVVRVSEVGFVLELEKPVTGFIHWRRIPSDVWIAKDEYEGTVVRAKVTEIRADEHKVYLRFESRVLG